jgi:Bacterial archaeo-eukaryotic release factor family 3
MRQISTDQLTGLLTHNEPPCISLYQPTHRKHPDNQQDPIRYRNLLTEIENSLLQKYPIREVRTLLEKYQSMAHDENFWNHRTDGLAIFNSPGTFQVFELQRAVPELLVVADSFHTKPLLRALQSADRYQVLALNRHEAKLYEGNRDALDEIELAEAVPRTIEEALGDELTEPHLTVASYGARGGRAGEHGVPAMHHGHGQKKDEIEIDNDRFFRVIDRAILEHHSRPSGLPLILAALPKHHPVFHKVSHNPFLMSEGIHQDPAAISAEQLRQEAWRTVEPRFQKRLSELVDNFRAGQPRQLASDDLSEVARALIAGRVATLLVEADRQIPGRLDSASGRVEFAELADPQVDDLLDDLGELALKMGGVVVVVSADRMPSDTGAAAIHRF